VSEPSSPPSNSPLPRQIPPVDTQRIEQRFAGRLEELRAALHGIDPVRLAERSGIRYDLQNDGRGSLHLAFWEKPLFISFPDLVVYRQASGEPVSPFEQAMLLYYLATADGEPLSGRWIAFSELPDGRFYNQAFQGYTGRELARAFQNDRLAFENAAQRLGGEAYALGDAAYVVHPLPRLPLLATYWQGDEDFPASSQILFDASASHYFPTEGYAILGSTLTRKLISAR
jgi:hypothetical protein